MTIVVSCRGYFVAENDVNNNVVFHLVHNVVLHLVNNVVMHFVNNVVLHLVNNVVLHFVNNVVALCEQCCKQSEAALY